LGKKLLEEYKEICLVSVVLKCFRTKCSIFFDWKNETKILLPNPWLSWLVLVRPRLLP